MMGEYEDLEREANDLMKRSNEFSAAFYERFHIYGREDPEARRLLDESHALVGQWKQVRFRMKKMELATQGAEIRKAREAAGLSRGQIAKKAKCSVSTVARIENGDTWERCVYEDAVRSSVGLGRKPKQS
jgi:DNA-binding XRE family transcriptional regulator